MANRVLAFVRDWMGGAAPEPPAFDKAAPGARALFMDENEAVVIYAKPWPFIGCPVDDRTNSTTWQIDGKLYAPARRDELGNWIFRRVSA